jgi:hypothetical protein
MIMKIFLLASVLGLVAPGAVSRVALELCLCLLIRSIVSFFEFEVTDTILAFNTLLAGGQHQHGLARVLDSVA